MNNFELQKGINALGGGPVYVDGFWGPKTQAAAEEVLDAFNIKVRRGKGLVPVAVYQLMMRKIGRIAVGPIDGIMGPITEAAIEKWEQVGFRDKVMEPVDSDKRMPDALDAWPRYANIEEYFGKAGTNNVRVALPWPKRLAWDETTTISSISINEECAESYIHVQRELKHAYGLAGLERLRINVTGGIYSNRPMRGGTKLSTHAYAVAEDYDPVNNKLRWGRDRAALARPEYRDFWAIWTAEGWTSLGKARNFDWMHVQACRL